VVIPLVAHRHAFAHAAGIAGIAPSPWAALTWNLANWVRAEPRPPATAAPRGGARGR
jgi:hypothetical protein